MNSPSPGHPGLFFFLGGGVWGLVFRVSAIECASTGGNDMTKAPKPPEA